jgi:hypothetical protein
MASKVLGGLGGAAGRRGRSRSASARGGAAHDKIARSEDDIADLEADLQTEVTEIAGRWDAVAARVTTVPVALEKADVSVAQLALVWLPTA